MDNNPVSAKKLVHFIGMGGIGMSGIARMYLGQGYAVQGTDLRRSFVLDELERLGAKIMIGHDAAHLGSADLMIYSSSIAADHPERKHALEKGICVLHRSEALAGLCRDKYTIAVTGTHGKTTTTSLIGTLLCQTGRDASVIVGGWVKGLGGNARRGQGPEMVIEADESDSSFLNFSPDLSVITNIEEEHMDHFGTWERILRDYESFLCRLKKGGSWIGSAEDERVYNLSRKNIAPCLLYGFQKNKASLVAESIEECPNGKRGISFNVSYEGNLLGSVHLKLLGRHNVLNALAAIGVGLKRGIDFAAISQALETYEGAGRRFDVRFDSNEIMVVDDYAHHPTEIQKTLEAAKSLKKNRLVVFFQPHRYSRTEAFLGAFGTSFFDADKVVVTDIYAASERPRPGISGQSLYETIAQAGHPDVEYTNRKMLFEKAKTLVRPGDLVMTMGAGDITELSRDLAGYLGSDPSRSLPRIAGENLFSGIRGLVKSQEPIAPYTYIRIGGPADYWIEPMDIDDLKQVLQKVGDHRLPLQIVGAGTNLLVSDSGLRGVVIHLAAESFRKIDDLGGGLFRVGAGLPNQLFMNYGLRHGLGGFEFLTGIPGSIGGAIAMNAGSHDRSMESLVDSIRVMTREGQIQVIPAKDIRFAYRHASFGSGIIVDAVLRLAPADRDATKQVIKDYRSLRQVTQELRYPSAGCMFKNPSPTTPSGRLIDEAGLKGFRVGNAQVSEVHANFIVNLGGATAQDVLSVVEEVRARVKEKFLIDLETEVKIL